MRLCLSWQAGAGLRRSASSSTAAARPTCIALHNKEYTAQPLNLSAGEVFRPGERALQVAGISEAAPAFCCTYLYVCDRGLVGAQQSLELQPRLPGPHHHRLHLLLTILLLPICPPQVGLEVCHALQADVAANLLAVMAIFLSYVLRQNGVRKPNSF